MSPALKTYTASDMMRVDNDLSSASLLKNFQQALTETLIILLLFVTVVCGRAITQPQCLSVLRRMDLLVWFIVFLGINTSLKQFYPKFDSQLLNAAIFSIVYTLMVPLKVD